MPLCFYLTPALCSSLGNGTQGHSCQRRSTVSRCTPDRSCTETGAWGFSPNRPSSLRGSAAVWSHLARGGSHRAPASYWAPRDAGSGSTCDFAFVRSALPTAPSAGNCWVWGAQSPWAPGGHPTGRDPRTRGRAGGAPTHVALQFPLGGRLDEPAGTHSVARAHRGRRRCFLQLGRRPAVGGSRARDADGAGPEPARPAPP